jgi:hypothetical protein
MKIAFFYTLLLLTHHLHSSNINITPQTGTLFMAHGQLIGGLSWGHIILKLELSEIIKEIKDYEKVIDLLKTMIKTPVSKPVELRLRYLKSHIEQQSQDMTEVMNNIIQSFNQATHPSIRVKRQALIALGGMLAGGIITSLFGQFGTTSLTNILNDKINLISSTVEHNTIQISQNMEDIKRLNTSLNYITEELGKQIISNREMNIELISLLMSHEIDGQQN